MVALRRHRALLLAVVGGIAFALTSPPTDLYPAVLVGLAFLSASIADAPNLRRAFGRAVVWGTSAGIVGMRFVPAVIQRFTPLGDAASYLALILLAAGQSLIWAIGAGVAWLLHRRARAPFEFSFAAGTFVALSLPAIFAWSPAGLVSPWPSLVQLGDLIGERGVSALFAAGAALLARGVMASFGFRPGEEPPAPLRARFSVAVARPLLASAGLFAALAIFGTWRMSSIPTESDGLPTLRVGLVDQAVAPQDRWEAKNHPSILRTLRELTRRAEADDAELTIWPEAAYPYPLDHDAPHIKKNAQAIVGVDQVRGPVLTGLITRAPVVEIAPGVFERNSYNSATVVAPDGSMQPVADKLQLLWFGEMVPAGDKFPWLRRMFAKSGGLVPGKEPTPLVLTRPAPAPEVRMGILNCYEDTLTDVGRAVVIALRPNLLVNITNDAWFYDTAESELHARLGAMRAIELRRDVVRAVNLGVTSWIDARGVVRARYGESRAAHLMATPSLRDGPLTLYARAGDTPMIAVMAAVTLLSLWRARRAPPLRSAGP
jgi:apolipoprotein N-acyltransferase